VQRQATDERASSLGSASHGSKARFTARGEGSVLTFGPKTVVKGTWRRSKAEVAEDAGQGSA
jgi:hypothetical protein